MLMERIYIVISCPVRSLLVANGYKDNPHIVMKINPNYNI